MESSPFLDRQLRDWLFRKTDGSHIDLEDVSMMGSDPLDFPEFERFLRRRRIEVLIPDAYTEVLVLGRTGWKTSAIEGLLRKREGGTLRVYSQEMFMVYLISRNDPLETPKIAMRMGRGHAGLEYLMSLGFRWPTTDVEGFGKPSYRSASWRAEGFLKARGYSVGEGVGNHPRLRRMALSKAYRGRIPERFGADYIQECGAPKSQARLRQMAKSIARFYRMGAGRLGPNSVACSQWKRDLAWLKRAFYAKHPQFKWPSITVAGKSASLE